MENFVNESIDLDHLPQLEAVAYQPVSATYFWVLCLRSGMSFAFVFFAYFILAFGLRDEVDLFWRQLIPVVLLVWVAFNFFRLYKVYKKKAYALRTHDVLFKKGWIWKKKTTIPYYRIQHTELSSGPFERIFDLSTLHVYTAGGSNSDLSIPGLLTDQGERMKKFILQKMGEDEEE